MGLCRKNDKVDEEDKLYTRDFLETNKLLLLGTGESGKTTIIKQMKILHINGYSNDEKKEKIPFIKQNIHESIYDILNNMDRIQPPTNFFNENAKFSGEYILKIGPRQPEEYNDEYYDHVKVAWNDPGVQETYKRANEYQLIGSAKHFLDQIDTIRAPDYIPSIQDILFCRIMTVSISKIEFDLPVAKKYGGGLAKFWMYDVGGQKGHRKKWIQVFSEAIRAILFLIAASDFDQNLREDETKNRLHDALELFQDICQNKYLRKSGLIVFLNKQDVLEEKINNGHKLEKYFPEFSNYTPSKKDGTCANEYERAKLFMRKQIWDIANLPVVEEQLIHDRIVKIDIPPRKAHVHFTTATDTNNIKKVFESVQEIILESNLETAFC